jgi:hypothetical protein
VGVGFIINKCRIGGRKYAYAAALNSIQENLKREEGKQLLEGKERNIALANNISLDLMKLTE